MVLLCRSCDERSVRDRGNFRELSGLPSYGAERGLAGAESDLAHSSYDPKKSLVDLQRLTTIQ